MDVGENLIMERSIQMSVSKQEIRDTWLLLGEQYITDDPAINFGRRAPYRHLGICTALGYLLIKEEISYTIWDIMGKAIDEDLVALDGDVYFCSPYNPKNKQLRGMYCLFKAAQCMGDE